MKNGKNKPPPNIPIYNSQSDFEQNLPQTVEILKSDQGHKVFLIGTVHFSLKSQDDVSVVIRNTNPAVVMLELCPQRKYMLELDEETLLKEASTLDTQKIREIIAQKGLINGMFYVSFLRTNAHITRQLGVAPGGECRRALKECKQLKECKLILGDRPIDITMQRALKPLSLHQKIQLTRIFSEPTATDITPEDVEAYKSRETDYLRNLRVHFPSVYRSFVTERDQILAHNLLLATKLTGNDSSNVVGVVGMGHMNGIIHNFGKTKAEDIVKIMKKDQGTPSAAPNVLMILSKLLKLFKHK